MKFFKEYSFEIIAAVIVIAIAVGTYKIQSIKTTTISPE